MTLLEHELLGASGLTLLFASVVCGAELCARKGWLRPEPARKSIHLAGGLGCLLFPFVVYSWISVLCLSILFATVFHLGENRKKLKSLSSVKRESLGSLLFPFSIFLLYVLSDGRLWLYIAGLLVLVLADTAAALTGTRFGRILYKTAPDQTKSLEGTLTFALVGFISTAATLWFLSDIPRENVILTAFLMAILLAGLESVSIGGTDNLFVPAMASFLLLKIPDKPAAEILFQCESLAGVAVIVAVVDIYYKTLRLRPLIVFGLIAYAAWTLGAADWMLAILCLFIVYNRICDQCAPLPSELSARKLLRPFYPQLAILFLANATMTLRFWFAPFLVANAVAASVAIAHRFAVEAEPRRLEGRKLAAAALLPATAQLLLCIPFQREYVSQAAPAIVTLCALISLAYARLVKFPLSPFVGNYAIPIVSSIAALIYAGIQYMGWVSVMRPTMWQEVFRCQ